jgi:cytochrome c oxidase subunit 2
VDVTATQWAWRFAYPGGFAAEGDERHWTTLVVPVGRPVYFRITSEDVVHSFWIPSRKLKVDAFPLRTTTATLLFPEPGSWHDGGRCNQYCGLNHTTMDFNVRAVPGPEFDRWLAERSQS